MFSFLVEEPGSDSGEGCAQYYWLERVNHLTRQAMVLTLGGNSEDAHVRSELMLFDLFKAFD